MEASAQGSAGLKGPVKKHGEQDKVLGSPRLSGIPARDFGSKPIGRLDWFATQACMNLSDDSPALRKPMVPLRSLLFEIQANAGASPQDPGGVGPMT